MRKLVVTFLIFSLCLGSTLYSSGIVKANTSTVTVPSKYNLADGFEIIHESEDSIEFLYEENSKTYIVKMKVNPDKSNINNEVYVINDTGEYELVRTSDMIIEDGLATVNSIENGEIKTFTIRSEKTTDRVNSEISDLIDTNNYNDLGPWEFWRSTTYREDIKGLTVELIASTIVGFYSWPLALALGAASILFAANSNAFWMYESVYFKYTKGPLKLPRGERTETTVYADKELRYYVEGPHIVEVYTPGWEP